MTLDPARWSWVEATLEAALRAPASGQRALVDRLTAGDALVRAEVLSLLEAHGAAEGFLESPLTAFAAPMLDEVWGEGDSLVGTTIDRYQLTDELGRGGGGVVYRAERADGQFEQRVALKVIRREHTSATDVERFRRERQILARLEHPHIARLLDGGVTADGRPYLVMELIAGQPITRFAVQRGLALADKLKLFVIVCQAVHYLHRNLIVHRDLKPGNILVTPEGVVKLLDFGIAAFTDAPVGTAGGQTMTPEYASPEQVLGEPVTTASDVYQLGVVLCELLTAVRPHQTRGRDRAAVLAAIPSERPPLLSEMAEQAQPGAGRRLRGDLDAIVAKALARNPEERYATAEELARDLERWIDHRPVRARPSSARYRTARFVRRHRLASALTTVLSIVAVSLVIYYTAQVREERDRAVREADKAMESARLLSGFFEDWDPDAADRGVISAADVLRDSVARAERELADRPEALAATLSVLGGLDTSLGNLARADTLLQRAAALQASQVGIAPTDRAATWGRQARLAQMRGDAGAGAALARKALEVYRVELGPNHPETLAVQLILAQAEGASQRLDEAGALLEDVLARVDSPRSSTASTAATRLGYNLFLRGRYAEAVALLRPTLALQREVFGSSHPFTIESMQALAAALRSPTQMPEAEALIRETLRIRRERYGDERAETAYNALSLAVFLERKGDMAGAEEAARFSLQYWRPDKPPHVQWALTLRTFAGLRLMRGDLVEAEAVLRRSLTMLRGLFAQGTHPDEGDILNRLAYILHHRRAPDAAEVYQQAVAFDDRRGAGPYFVTDGYDFLAMVAEERGDLTVASRLYTRAVTLYRAELPDAHPYRRAAEEGLVRLAQASAGGTPGR